MVWNEKNPLLIDEDKWMWKRRIQIRQGEIHSKHWDELSVWQDKALDESRGDNDFVKDTKDTVEIGTIMNDTIAQGETMNGVSDDLSNHLSKLGWSMIKLICFVFGAQFIIIMIIYAINKQWLQSPWFDLVSAFSTSLIGYPLFIYFVKKLPEGPKQPIRKLTSKQFLCILAISIAIVYISNLVGTVILYIISIFQKKEVYDPVGDIMSNSSVWFQILYVVILGPIMEEVIFRKYLLNRLKVYGDKPAIIISGIAFGLFHMNFTQFFYAAALGCFFGYIALRTNTIRYVVILHILINFFGGMVVSYIGTLKYSVTILYLYLMLNIVVTVIGIFYMRKYKDRVYFEGTYHGFKVKDYIKAKGVGTYLVISIILMVLNQFF